MEAALGLLGGAPRHYSGEHPESEPEVGYLCNFLRFSGEISLALALHMQGEEVYSPSADGLLGDRVGQYVAALCESRLTGPGVAEARGGFADWFQREFERPALAVRCVAGERSPSFSAFPMAYLRIRKMLFAAPMLI